ncbi:hypothetical protein Aduo_017377 [Ancylostoma duodenale]
MLRLLTLSALFVSTSPFFFGTGGGCNCAPSCAPAPACAPPPAPPCPAPVACGGGGGGGYVQPPPLPPPVAPPPPPPPPPSPIIVPGYVIGGGVSPVQPLQVQEQPQQQILPQSPVYTAPQAVQPSFPVQHGGNYGQGVVATGPNFQIPQPPPPDAQVIAPQPPQQAVGGSYQVPEQPVYPPQGGPGPVYQPGPGFQTGPGPVYQPGPGPAYMPGPGPVYQPGAGAGYEQAAEGAGFQGAPVAAQRDPAQNAQQQELATSLQHEAAEAAGSKNEEVIEEQDRALEKSGKGKVEVTTVVPAASSTIADIVEEKMVDVADLKLTDDPLCNSEDLRKLMLDNMDSNLNSSKRLIQLAAEAQFGGRFDVICANGDFSYVTNTELFCQETKGDVSCYTYRQL